MKRLILSLATIALVSCGGNQETKKTEETKTEVCKLKYDYLDTKVGFGGFKTTEKKEVKGQFDKFKVEGVVLGETAEEVFANASINIETSSVNTGDAGRDEKLNSFFFGNMLNTSSISGKVKEILTDSNQVVFTMKLNDVESDVKMMWTVSGDTVNIEGMVDLLDFSAQPAVDSLNVACYDLHKGADGESKTWSEAKVYVQSVLKKDCK